MKVCKFGGTSMANAVTMERVANIVTSDKDRRYIIVSAPGKRDKSDIKITDILYACFDELEKTGKCDKSFKVVRERFSAIIKGLKITLDIDKVLDDIKKTFEKNKSKDYIASRGEYVSALILSKKLGYDFVDAAELIKFNDEEEFQLESSIDLISQKFKKIKKAVVPGFYGSLPNGEIKTFSRGGSDITGAIVARAVSASLYENWTDVDGFLTADPRIVEKPKLISCLSYRELRELAYMGAEVLHPESVFPVRSAGIPINIKNTFNEQHEGTMIVAPKNLPESDSVITGISGRKGFTIINIEKDMMNAEVGFARKVLSVLEEENVSFEHMPSGIDSITLIMREECLSKEKEEILLNRLKSELEIETIRLERGISLIVLVGAAMAQTVGVMARCANALGRAGINIELLVQGASEISIVFGIKQEYSKYAIKELYKEFFVGRETELKYR